MYNFHNILRSVIKDLDLSGKLSQIYNCDETSFCHDQSKTKVVGILGGNSQHKTSTSGRENTSVLLCCSAEGRLLAHLCVFK